MTSTAFRAHVHSMTRLDISTAMPFDEFRAAFERAARAPDTRAVLQILADKGTWNDVPLAGQR